MKNRSFSPIRTKYPGVYIILGTDPEGSPRRIIYVSYRVGGKQHFEKIGVEGHRLPLPDGRKLTLAVANQVRSNRISGKELPNRERRAAERARKAADSRRWTFNRLWEAWQKDPENEGKRGTRKANEKYRKHIRERFGGREPASLLPIDIDRLRLSLAEDHSKETTKSIIGLITRIARYGASKNLCAGLPFPVTLRGKKLGRDPEAKRAPSDDQVDAYIKTCEKWPDRQAGAFQLFIAFTGIRRGSVRNLKWADIDLENHTAILRDSKTGDVQIVLGDDAITLLRDHPVTEGVEYVFSGSAEDGGRSQREIDRIPRQIMDAAGLPAHLDPCHSFRRRLATKVEATHGIATAMKAGGWKSPAMVLNYTATTKATLREAANLLSRKIVEQAGGE